ncbi:MAG: PAS domain S-box protein [Armatimonadetes bacterium]|nr:PAS domain S-box protein [Armatimonadota bacterium]
MQERVDRLESELRAVRRWLAQSPAVFYVLRVEGGDILPSLVSDAVTLLLGYEVAEALDPEWWLTHLHPEDRDRAVESLQGTLERDFSRTEYRLAHRNGDYRWVVDDRRLIRDSAGQPCEIAGVLTDATDSLGSVAGEKTELRQSEGERIRLAEQLELLLGSTSEGIFGVDVDRRCTFMNGAGARMIGYEPEELMGLPIHEVLHHHYPDGRPYPSQECPNYRALVHGEHGRVDNEVFWRRDGSSFPVEYSYSPLVDSGAIKGVVVTFTDITEKKSLQAQFLRAQRMESIGRLASGIAHDLNNILTPITLTLPLLRAEMSALERAELLDVVEASAQRGASIIHQLLTLGRGLPGDRTCLALKYIIRELVNIIRETFPHAITVSSEVAGNLSGVIGDATQIHQVLLNLCVNARDAMPRGGSLSLQASNVELDEHYTSMNPEAQPGKYVKLEVRDTGSGISPDILDKIFDPFFTTKDPGKGTGLGLSTVVGILKAHGGFAQVNSDVGRGTSFEIYLPASAEELSAAAGGEAALVRGSGECILVVDDEPAIRRSTAVALSKYGYEVITAADGAEAVGLYARWSEKIQLVLTDTLMPIMDGFSVVRAITRIAPDIRIIVASSTGDDPGCSSKANLLAMPSVKKHLIKPYTAQCLLQAIHEVLQPPSTAP